MEPTPVPSEIYEFTQGVNDIVLRLDHIYTVLFFALTVSAAVFVIYLVFKPLIAFVEEI
jgi:hypothetical protein